MIKKICVAVFCFMPFVSGMAQTVDEKEVPSNVRSVVAEHIAGHPVSLWVKDKNRDKYVATVLSENMLRIVEVSMSGKWIATTDGLMESKVPSVVMKTIQEKYVSKGYEASNFQFVRESDGTNFYGADMSSEDRDLFVTFSLKGQVLQEEER